MGIVEKSFGTGKPSRWLLIFGFSMIAAVILGAFSLAAASELQKKHVQEIGVAVIDESGDCTADVPATLRGNDLVPELTIAFSGGLEGCVYTYVNASTASCADRADGTVTYFEEGNEIFVGTYSDDGEVNGESGTMTTKYWFEATFPTMTDCENFTNQIDGGCVHTFLIGTGTGVFEGARGEYSVVDNVVDGVAVTLPYILELRVSQ